MAGFSQRPCTTRQQMYPRVNHWPSIALCFRTQKKQDFKIILAVEKDHHTVNVDSSEARNMPEPGVDSLLLYFSFLKPAVKGHILQTLPFYKSMFEGMLKYVITQSGGFLVCLRPQEKENIFWGENGGHNLSNNTVYVMISPMHVFC